MRTQNTAPLPDKPGWGTESQADRSLNGSRSHTPAPDASSSTGTAMAVGLGSGAAVGLGVSALTNPVPDIDLDYNAWGDEEGEIQMTFA